MTLQKHGRPTRRWVKEMKRLGAGTDLMVALRREHAWRCWSQLQLFACVVVLYDVGVQWGAFLAPARPTPSPEEPA